VKGLSAFSHQHSAEVNWMERRDNIAMAGREFPPYDALYRRRLEFPQMSLLIEQHRDGIAELCRRFHVKRLELFGSASRDEERS
jgi:hypothetical protein